MSPPGGPSDWAPIIHDVIPFLTTVFTGVMAWQMSKVKEGQRQAAVRAEEVKTTLSEVTAHASAKADETLHTVNVVHALVNNDRHLILQANAALAGRIAAMSGSAADRAAADAAAAALARHDFQQGVADALPGVTPPAPPPPG